MKNIIEIDAAKNCLCELVSSIYDGTNRLILKIKSGNGKKLVVEKTEVAITNQEFLYEIPEVFYTGTDEFSFMISDDEEKKFRVKKVKRIQGDMIIKQITNETYELRTKIKADMGADVGDRIKIYGVVKEWNEDIWAG